MHELKLTRLKQDYPDLPAKVISPVPPSDAAQLRSRLREQLGNPGWADDVGLIRTLRDRSAPVEGVDASSEAFDLSSALATAKISPQRQLYINWSRFDDIDQVELDALTRHFDYFWYPKADDIDLFDSTLSWVLSIDHEGRVWSHRP